MKNEKQISSPDLEHTVDQLRDVYFTLRDQFRKKWDRDLPLEELLFDRWERAQELGFGKGTSLYHNSYVYGKVKVGKNTWIGPFTILDGSGGLEIGDYCSISSGVQIYTHDSVEWAVSGGQKEIKRASTKIGSCCYIGPNTVVANGVTIGDYCIIGANSLVLEDIPSHSKAAGNPCKIIEKISVG